VPGVFDFLPIDRLHQSAPQHFASSPPGSTFKMHTRRHRGTEKNTFRLSQTAKNRPAKGTFDERSKNVILMTNKGYIKKLNMIVLSIVA